MKRAFLIFCFAIFCVFGAVAARSVLQVDEDERTLLLAVRKPEATVASFSSIEVSFETGPALREFDYTIKCVLFDDALVDGCDADAVGDVVTGQTTKAKSTIAGEVTGLEAETDYQCYVIVEAEKLSKCMYVATPTIEAPPAPANGWTARATPGEGYRSVAWGGPDGAEIFVAVGYAGVSDPVAYLMTSTDGTVWSEPAGLSLPLTRLRDVTWGAPQARTPAAGKFVAVSSSTPGTVITSEDGVNWVADQTDIPENEWRGVTYSPELGLYVAVAWNDGTENVMTSPDGDTWTEFIGANDNDWTSVAWSPTLNTFAAVSTNGNGDRIMTSSDGVCWNAVTTGELPLTSVTWGGPDGGMFVAVGEDSNVLYSTDGLNWQSGANIPLGAWQSVTWGGPEGYEQFVAVSEDNVMTSPDGITWTPSPGTIPVGTWQSVTYGGPAGSELFAAVAPITTSSEYAMTSYSGIGA